MGKKIGRGGHHGGIHWGIAADEHALYVPIADIGEHPFAKGDRRPGIHALDIETEQFYGVTRKTLVHKIFECFAGSPRQFHYLPASFLPAV